MILSIIFWLILAVIIIMSVYSLFKYQLPMFFGYLNKKVDSNNQHKPQKENLVRAQNIFSKRVKENDLKIVAGINPKIEGLFHAFGIKTWEDLAGTSVEKCQEILKSVGNKYKIQKPKTWPKQAKLANQGKWKELQECQGNLISEK
ncbi:hypothetical protein LNI90_03870 [Tenacibaculum dicentrarchi]|uniref:LSU ribosomal protein L21p n=1 Tax=Tenacibaculum dicentrarchi TaxID=669041 RepID=A0ABM9P3C5_9FLAO|nr:hypothetical protein [Tenacibaculum dicentrarchi]MCD8407065.1 hypothetical protein [Tenacibaculum dicentrarchi]MCD8413958.1 hypothetical protein [Tenacibaculum dicentrarchi]MCD8419404.1 hypothetical protein [Tenacibaculum dicentrarchi]MCD8424420.1 hypothetical protein [Tenacibaculum dicentrarchi]